MTFKKTIVHISITFTFMTFYDIIYGLSKGIVTISYLDLLNRLSLITIGFGSMMIIFNYFKNLPLRFVQIIHFIITLILFGLYLLLASVYTDINSHYILNLLINYPIIYILIAIIYEFYYRYTIKQHNIILKNIDQM